MFGHSSKCQICGSIDLQVILKYGHQCPVHGHRTKDQLNEEEVFYPLNLCFCNNCFLVQIDYIIDPQKVFYPEYPYMTSMTNMLVNNFRELANYCYDKFLDSQDLVVDIGSNDGSLLKFFQEKGIKVLGIEATNIANIANERGINTWQEFFNSETVSKIIREYGKAKLVTAANVFAHIPNPIILTKIIKELLADDGVFISESQYFLDTIQKNQIDEIYDEHLRYYSLKPYIKLMELAGMSVINAERISSAGGSIRIFAKPGKHEASANVARIIKEEEKFGLYDLEKLKKFGNEAIIVKHELMELILNCKKEGRIVGIGGAARSNTLLGFAGINNSLIDYIAEKPGSPKIGLYTPHTHIPIVYEERLFIEQPEFGLVLSWHIGDDLMNILRGKGYKGKFVMPLPKPHIVP